MIKETLLASAFGLLGLVTVACGSQKKDLMAGTDYVNPFIGASTNTEAAVLTMAWEDLPRCDHPFRYGTGKSEYDYRGRQWFRI